MPNKFFCFFVCFASIFVSQTFGMHKQLKTTPEQEIQKSEIRRALSQQTEVFFNKLQNQQNQKLISRQLKNAILQLNQIGNISRGLTSIPGQVAEIFLRHGLINRYLICIEMTLDQTYTTLILNWTIFSKSTTQKELSNKYFSPIYYFLKDILKKIHTYIHKKAESQNIHILNTKDKNSIETTIKFIQEDLQIYNEERIANFLKTTNFWFKKFTYLKQLIEHSKYNELSQIKSNILTQKNLIQQKEIWQELLNTEKENYEETIDLEDTQSQISTQSSMFSNASSVSFTNPEEYKENTVSRSFTPNTFNEFENELQLTEIKEKLNYLEKALQDLQNLITNIDYQEHFLALQKEFEHIENQIKWLKENKKLNLEILQNNETKIESLKTIILENQEIVKLASSGKINSLKRIEDQLENLKISCNHQKPHKSKMRILKRSCVYLLFIPVLFAFLYLYALINSYQTNFNSSDFNYPNYNYRYRGPRPM